MQWIRLFIAILWGIRFAETPASRDYRQPLVSPDCPPSLEVLDEGEVLFSWSGPVAADVHAALASLAGVVALALPVSSALAVV